MVHNTIDFVRETNLFFALWSREPLFEGQQPQNRRKSVIGSTANFVQHKIHFPLAPNLIGFVS